MAASRNKVELETQILCAALRQSWAAGDTDGALASASELYQLFPDLLPPIKIDSAANPINYYDILGLSPRCPANGVATAFLTRAKGCLAKRSVKESKDEYTRILDAGFILRKPRLRLSHDLTAVRRWLMEARVISEDGTLERLEKPTAVSAVPESQMAKTQPLIFALPRLVELMKEAQIIGPAEVQALCAQMTLAPELPVEKLVLDAGYVTVAEMNSLKLAEMLLDQGKITMAQYMVAIYDERTSGIRMAESLQVRGWLPVDVTPSERQETP